jgi:hypothetical protein
MEAGVIVCFGLISDYAVFAAGKNTTIRNGLEQTRHDQLLRQGRGWERNKKRGQIAFLCDAAWR